MNLPRITIITPSYNQGKYIEQTIQSVLSQGYPDLEYLVMDGGSTDQTIAILKKYGDQIAWVSEKDRGQSYAINKGLHRATGEVIAFLNSDDIYEPGVLFVVGEFFSLHPDAYWLTGWCHTVDAQGSKIRQLVTLYKKFWLVWRSYTILLIMDYISQPATFWRNEVIKQIGPFDEGLHYSMDYDYSLRVGKQYKLWVLNNYLASFRIHPSSKSEQIHDHFNADLSIAQRYTKSRFLVYLHRLHNKLITFLYLKMQQ